MGYRDYTVEFDNVAVAAAQDWFELTPADDKPIEIYGIFGGQYTAEGDAAEDYWRWGVIRGHATSGSGGSTATPRPLNRSDTAAGFTCEINNTTIASAGTPLRLHSDADNVRSKIALWLPDGSEWGASQADTTLVVRLLSTPDVSMNMSMTLYVREYW